MRGVGCGVRGAGRGVWSLVSGPGCGFWGSGTRIQGEDLPCGLVNAEQRECRIVCWHTRGIAVGLCWALVKECLMA